MKFWLGVTDNRWFDFLAEIKATEVNFWQPSGRAPFKGLKPGAPFLFKLKQPNNHLAGGGTFVKFVTYPLSIVWDIFQGKNGAADRKTFERIIRPLLPDPEARDPDVGCTVLTSTFFMPRQRWIEASSVWQRQIVSGRYFDTTLPEGLNLWNLVEEQRNDAEGCFEGLIGEQRYGEPTLVRPRLGQSAFRVVVTESYGRQCAVTGESTLPVLQAAHIRPYAVNGPHEVQNGLLLRSDFHKLFDEGFVTVTPDLHLQVSPRIREAWFNGKAYYRLHGKPLANLPDDPSLRPSKQYLAWHNNFQYQD